MKISKPSIIAMVNRANKRPGESLALVGERYQTVREVQWPIIRRYLAQLSLRTSYLLIDNSEMSVTVANGSRFRCFSTDRPDQMNGLSFTNVLILEEITESELISLIATGIIPPRYIPPPASGP